MSRTRRPPAEATARFHVGPYMAALTLTMGVLAVATRILGL